MSLDSHRVFANDGDANPAFWTVMHGGTHGEIVKALEADSVVTAAVKAKLDDPNDDAKRAFMVDHINRATVNCIGQKIAGQHLAPEKAAFSIYNLLSGGRS